MYLFQSLGLIPGSRVKLNQFQNHGIVQKLAEIASLGSGMGQSDRRTDRQQPAMSNVSALLRQRHNKYQEDTIGFMLPETQSQHQQQLMTVPQSIRQ